MPTADTTTTASHSHSNKRCQKCISSLTSIHITYLCIARQPIPVPQITVSRIHNTLNLIVAMTTRCCNDFNIIDTKWAILNSNDSVPCELEGRDSTRAKGCQHQNSMCSTDYAEDIPHRILWLHSLWPAKYCYISSSRPQLSTHSTRQIWNGMTGTPHTDEVRILDMDSVIGTVVIRPDATIRRSGVPSA